MHRFKYPGVVFSNFTPRLSAFCCALIPVTSYRNMRPRFFFLFLLAAAGTDCAQTSAPVRKDHTLGYDDTPFIPGSKWRVHDVSRPRPDIITPGTESSQEKPGRPPSDAIVLFDGKDFSKWTTVVRGQ